MNLHPRGENGQTGGIIEPLIVEWIMDYDVFPQEKRKEVNEGRRPAGKGRKECAKGTCCVLQPQGSSGLLRKRENSNLVWPAR